VKRKVAEEAVPARLFLGCTALVDDIKSGTNFQCPKSRDHVKTSSLNVYIRYFEFRVYFLRIFSEYLEYQFLSL
jgi:hypothetical protein